MYRNICQTLYYFIIFFVFLGWNNQINVPTDVYLVAGWGRTSNVRWDRGDISVAGVHSKILKKLEVPFIEARECKERYDIFGKITDNKQVCAGGIKGNKYIVQLTPKE